VQRHPISRAVAPLRCVFWGGLICVFDITYSVWSGGRGFRIDVLDDAVGALLIAVGVFRLGALPVDGRYVAAMVFVRLVAFLAVLDEIRAHVAVQVSTPEFFLLHVFGVVSMLAIVVFARAMRRLCEIHRLHDAASSWSVTTILFVIVYLLPLGLFYGLGAVAIAAGESFRVDLGPAGLVAMPVFAIPLIHLFVSTSRMKRAALASGSRHPAR
jgi:hypothetical protein